MRAYWLAFFTDKTWREFRKSGAKVCGFRRALWYRVQRMKAGDYLFCYNTSAARFVGIFEVASGPFEDSARIWKDEVFPARVKVKRVVELSGKSAVPLEHVEAALAFYRDIRHPFDWSPARLSDGDGVAVARAMGVKLKRQPVSGAPGTIPTTREHVVWAYRLFFDREPENAAAIKEKLNALDTTKALRMEFMTSEEFRRRSPDLAFMNERSIVIKEIEKNVRMFVDLSDCVIGLSIVRGNYELEETEFIRRTVKPGQNVLDIGANIGCFAFTMASIVGAKGMVYAFEPIARNAELLKRSIHENRFSKRVVLERVAVADKAGEIELVTPERSVNWGGAHLRAGDAELPEGHVAEKVKAVALDDYSFRRPISFIKIDIEGAEPLALRGAGKILKKDRPVILSEVNPAQLKKVAGCSAKEFISEIESYGYDSFYLKEGKLVRKRGDSKTRVMQSVVFLPKKEKAGKKVARKSRKKAPLKGKGKAAKPQAKRVARKPAGKR